MNKVPFSETKKGRNRQKLIDATLSALVEHGYANASISEIIKIAELSRGMVHLHFANKEAMVVAAAASASSAYYVALDKQLSGAAPTPEAQVEALIDYDLSPEVLNIQNVSVWYELRGAARTSPAIGKYSGTRDQQLESIYCDAFSTMTNDSAQSDISQDATKGIVALSEGFWTDFMLNPDIFDRKASKRIAMRFLNGLFPDHFQVR